MKADGTGQNQITNSVGDDISADWQYLPSPDTIGVYRPSTSQFLLRNSTTAGPPNETIAFGQVGDLPVAGDWNGDGQDTQGVFRNGQFLLRQPFTFFVLGQPHLGIITLTVNFGEAGDLPVVGDWNGDGTDTVGVFRPSTGQWLLTNSPNTNNSTPPINLNFNFGLASDTPVAGDWNDDGSDSIGTFNAGSWALRNSNSAGAADITVLFGTAAGARPVVGDWNGDGTDTIGVLLPSNVFGATTFGLNNVNANLTGNFDILVAFGADGDLPVSGDWDVKPSNNPPNSGVNNPSDGSIQAGQTQYFTTTCSDSDGWHDIATIDFKIARNDGKGNGLPVILWVQFDENTNLIRLYDPDLQTWHEGAPGSNITLSSRFADLHLAGTSVQGSGPTGPSVQITWEIVFKDEAVGHNYKQYLKITDDAGGSTGFDHVGSWNVAK